jgi:hypothetical protein
MEIAEAHDETVSVDRSISWTIEQERNDIFQGARALIDHCDAIASKAAA